VNWNNNRANSNNNVRSQADYSSTSNSNLEIVELQGYVVLHYAKLIQNFLFGRQ
jgi:hypothetical protein